MPTTQTFNKQKYQMDYSEATDVAKTCENLLFMSVPYKSLSRENIIVV